MATKMVLTKQASGLASDWWFALAQHFRHLHEQEGQCYCPTLLLHWKLLCPMLPWQLGNFKREINYKLVLRFCPKFKEQFATHDILIKKCHSISHCYLQARENHNNSFKSYIPGTSHDFGLDWGLRTCTIKRFIQ